MYYEALDELEKDDEGYATPATETREWVMEEIAVARWFRENPRYIGVKVFHDVKLLEGCIEIPDDIEVSHTWMTVILDDYPDYLDDFDFTN